MTTHGFVEYEKSGHVATVTMNRPERLNARGAQIVPIALKPDR